jgi:hypothetical protein
MSTEPYPEVSGDESAIVPPQSARPAEWPKKIRTLTAAELDRLTIDSGGRFYWDGKLVNYEPPNSRGTGPKSPDTADRQAMDIIDRAVYELGDRKSPEPIEGAELPKSIGSSLQRGELRTINLDLDQIEEQITGGSEGQVAPRVIRATDRLHLSLSRWQSIGAVIVAVGVVVASVGLAAFGWVAAHDWGCRTGLVQSYCDSAANPGIRRPHTDIPA